MTATGTAPLTYRWQKNGGDLVGETGRTLRLQNVTPADAGVSRVVVSNGAGSVTSDVATLTVDVN